MIILLLTLHGSWSRVSMIPSLLTLSWMSFVDRLTRKKVISHNKLTSSFLSALSSYYDELHYNDAEGLSLSNGTIDYFYVALLYHSVSQGLGTSKFTNLIGGNRYWPRSRFSHLDRQCFAVKKLETKMHNQWPFSSNKIYFCKCHKVDERKKAKRTSKLWKN